jgi:hypothetical protein
MVIFNFIYVVVLLLFANIVATAGGRKGYTIATGVGIVGIMLSICLGGPASFICSVAVTAVAAVHWAVAPRFWFFLVGSVLAASVAFVANPWAISEVAEWSRLKERYPVESLEQRLVFAKQPVSLLPATAASMPGSTEKAADSKATGAPETKFEELENQLKEGGGRFSDGFGRASSYLRVESLRMLHAGVVEQFINSSGFGVGRRIRMFSPEYVELSDPGPIPLPGSEAFIPPESAETLDASVLTSPDSTNLPSEEFEQLHVKGFLDFFNIKRFGWIQDRRRVVGFVPHQFNLMPRTKLEVKSLELVSLLKFDEPLVYVSKNLPRMDELKDAPTRALTPFEKTAHAQLEKGEDLQIKRSPPPIEMLGSIRATTQCLECHDAKRGDLLGAFSYRLVPAGQAPTP